MSERECPYCHRSWPDTDEYYSRTRHKKCRPCKREYARQYYKDHPGYNRQWQKANPDKVRGYVRKWSRAHSGEIARQQKVYSKLHPEIHRRYAKKYRLTHRESERNRYRRWYKANPEKGREQTRRRNARKLNNQLESDVTAAKIIELKRRSKGRCYWCGVKAKPLHIDHITPLAKGGPHMMWNLCVSCAKCNCSKQDKLPQQLGLLF